MTIVMGLGQHRAQITAEWLDYETGELTRSRISPAHRDGVRRFCETFRGRELEVRELLMIDRVPESWTPPDQILDLRAQVRLRHTLSHQRGEWQQRIQSVLYHHGCPQRGELLTLAGREWLTAQPRSPAAREQITVALAIIDALDIQLAPLDGWLRAFARHQPGCRALLSQFGVGELTAVTILAELGDAGRFSSSQGGGPLRWPGHHRAPIRSATRLGASLPPRPARVAVGAV